MSLLARTSGFNEGIACLDLLEEIFGLRLEKETREIIRTGWMGRQVAQAKWRYPVLPRTPELKTSNGYSRVAAVGSRV